MRGSGDESRASFNNACAAEMRPGTRSAPPPAHPLNLRENARG